MALSDQDKQRIREEETFREQVREELRRKNPATRRNAAIFWAVLVAVTLLLAGIVRKNF